MRIRTIKPDFFKDEDLASLQPLARLAFAGLWCLCDREGRTEDRPRRIKVEVLPYDDCDMDAILWELHAARFIARYEVGDVRVIQVVNFAKHQRITGKEAETESTLPEMPDGFNWGDTGKQRGNNGEAPGTAGKEGKGKEGKGNGISPTVSPRSTDPTDWDAVQSEWNALAARHGLRKVERLTEQRKAKYRLRKAEGFTLAAVESHIAASEFLRSGSWFGWDWLMENSEHWLRVTEGKYDKSASQPALGMAVGQVHHEETPLVIENGRL